MDTDDTLLVQMVGILANVKRAVEYLMDKELMQLVVFFLLYYSPFDSAQKVQVIQPTGIIVVDTAVPMEENYENIPMDEDD